MPTERERERENNTSYRIPMFFYVEEPYFTAVVELGEERERWVSGSDSLSLSPSLSLDEDPSDPFPSSLAALDPLKKVDGEEEKKGKEREYASLELVQKLSAKYVLI